MRTLWAACLAALLFSAHAWAADPVTIKIGELLDRSGSIATPSWAASVALAAHDVNGALDQAGRNDIRFALLGADSKNTPAVARAAAQDLVRQGARALLTDSSQDDIAVHSLVLEKDPSKRLQVPIVCMACTSPLINDAAATDPDATTQAALRNADGFNFRTTLSDNYQAHVIARWLESQGKGGDMDGDSQFKVSIYASDDPYGRAFSKALEAALRTSEKVAVEQIYHPVQADAAKYDWAGDVAKLLDKHNDTTGADDGPPDAVVEITFPKFAASFTRAYLEKKSPVRLVHTHNFRSVRVTAPIGNLIEGQEGTSQAVLGTGPGAAAFAAELKETTGHAPAFRDSTAYDAAVMVMLAALFEMPEKDPASVSGAQVRNGLRKISDAGGVRTPAGLAGLAAGVPRVLAHKPINYEGASGPCHFDSLGNIVADVTRFRFHRADFEDVQRFGCTKDPRCPAE